MSSIPEGLKYSAEHEWIAEAGAAGVVIFNQGDTEDRKGLLNATLGDAYSGGIPVLFATYEIFADQRQESFFNALAAALFILPFFLLFFQLFV